MKHVLAVIALCVSASGAIAGLACPIVDIQYVGSPNWLSNRDILDGLESQQTWVGISSRQHDDGTLLTRIAPGSAAERAGLLKDDIILTVNEKPDQGFSDIAIGEAAALMVRRNDTTLPITLTMGRADPVHFALANAFDSDPNGCPSAKIGRASPIVRDIIMKNALTEDRAFRCSDAHEVLRFMGQKYEIEEAYLIRGSRRLLLTIPHFGTACISSAALDGDALTKESSLAFLMEAVTEYIDYQHANP